MKRAKGSFDVNYLTRAVNGFEEDSFVSGLPPEQVTAEFKEFVGSKLLVGVALENDLRSLNLDPNQVMKTFDLQTFYRRPDPKNEFSHSPMSLRDMYFLHFQEDIQEGTHDAATDSYATISVFKEGFLKIHGGRTFLLFSEEDAPNLNSRDRKKKKKHHLILPSHFCCTNWYRIIYFLFNCSRSLSKMNSIHHVDSN